MRTGAIWALATALAASAPGMVCATETAPVATAVTLEMQGDATRLSFDLSRGVAATARPLVNPDRIVIDLPEVNFQIDPAEGRNLGGRATLVRGFRFGLVEPGKSRIVVDLSRPACVSELDSIASAAPARLTLALAPCDERKFVELAKAKPQDSATPAAASPAPPAVIVLDPGHGGADGGAHGAHGELEKTIVFAFAEQLKRQLEATGRFRVVLTRQGDDYVSLEDRVQTARDANASLMISIHADSLPDPTADVSGTTVYTCSERASDAEAARIAEHENALDRGGGVAKPVDPGVADILFDLKRRETRAYAHLFSRGLVSELKGASRLNRNPERSAGFVVLKAPDFPSVLVELGYLSNPQDVVNLTSPPWRERIAQAMAAAVERFFPPTRNSGGGEAKAGNAVAATGGASPALRATDP